MFSTGGLRSICWQLSNDREVNLEHWVMDRGKAGDGQARGRQMADDKCLTVSNLLSKKASICWQIAGDHSRQMG